MSPVTEERSRPLRVVLHICIVALALVALGAMGDWPPSMQAQSTQSLEQHLDNTDRNVTQNGERITTYWGAVRDMRAQVEDDHTNLAVLEGNIGLLKWIAGGIMVLAAANSARTVKSKKP